MPDGHARAAANRRVAGRASTPAFDPVALGATMLGRGAYGTAYVVRVDALVADFLAGLLSHGRHRVVHATPRAFDAVVIKSTRLPSGDAAVAAAAREAGIHRAVAARCDRRAGVSACPVPAFFFAAAGDDGCYYTVMGAAEGVPLTRYVRGLTAESYVAVERAAAWLWLAGVAHADLHPGNVLLAFRGDRWHATIIDFGFAVLMPPALRRRIARAMADVVAADVPTSLGAVWDAVGVTEYTNRVQHARDARITWYNPDGKALKKLFGTLSPSEAARVPSVRRREWRRPL